MSLGHMGDSKPLLLSGPEVALDVAIGIDDQRLPAGVTPKEVTGLSELRIVKAFEKHEGLGAVGYEMTSYLPYIYG